MKMMESALVKSLSFLAEQQDALPTSSSSHKDRDGDDGTSSRHSNDPFEDLSGRGSGDVGDSI